MLLIPVVGRQTQGPFKFQASRRSIERLRLKTKKKERKKEKKKKLIILALVLVV